MLQPETLVARGRVEALSGADRVHFCGAYLGYGFHEDGVRSAMNVARRIDAV
jgi:predicted NAD/FAD-binding protein